MCLRRLPERIELLARQARPIRRDDRPHPPGPRDGIVHERRCVGSDAAGQIDDFEAESQVRLVDSESLHRIMMREALKWRRNAVASLRPEVDQYPLDDRQHIVLADERRLEIDLGELRLTIGAKILVAETARNLEIAVEAGHHQQLLVDLWRLRQRVELAGVHTTGHEVIAGTFGCGLGEDRRLDLEKAKIGERAA